MRRLLRFIIAGSVAAASAQAVLRVAFQKRRLTAMQQKQALRLPSPQTQIVLTQSTHRLFHLMTQLAQVV